MELIIGGAYAGKLSFALEHCGCDISEAFDLSRGLPGGRCRILYHLEEYDRSASNCGARCEEILANLLPHVGESGVIIAREIGCGIVPLEASERIYREEHGKVLRALAERSEHVYRVFCGIPEVLK